MWATSLQGDQVDAGDQLDRLALQGDQVDRLRYCSATGDDLRGPDCC